MGKFRHQLARHLGALARRLAAPSRRRLAEDLYHLQLSREVLRRQTEHPNPLCRHGRYGFAQSDEDGLTLEILRRLGIAQGVFCEFGVGDGTENNTLILLALGWRGVWFDGQEIALDLRSPGRLRYEQAWITRENVVELYRRHELTADVVSMDLDGNDFHVAEALLRYGVRPALFIVEYNGKFPPDASFVMPYDPGHRWRGDDYFGASLRAFFELFRAHGYRLICCNAATGANAFFVPEAHAEKFPEVPLDIRQVYAEPHYFLRRRKFHATSVRTLQRLVA